MQRSGNAEMLDYLQCPAFFVKDGMIDYANPAAKGLFLTPGTPLAPYLEGFAQDYQALESGCITLTLFVGSVPFGAFVTKAEDGHLFLLDQQQDDPGQQALALASVSLRRPLSAVMQAAEYFCKNAEALDEEGRRNIQELNRASYQILRQLANMSAAPSLGKEPMGYQLVDLKALTDEIFEKAAALFVHTKAALRYQGLEKQLIMTVHPERLERAIFNLLSNALHSMDGPGTVEVQIRQTQGRVLITVSDDGRGITDDVLRTVFSRYQRQPALEPGSAGIGLGLSIVRSAAAAHGGTVLLERIHPRGTRVTLTLALRAKENVSLRSPIMAVDYAGEHDHALVELSDVLSPEAYL